MKNQNFNNQNFNNPNNPNPQQQQQDLSHTNLYPQQNYNKPVRPAMPASTLWAIIALFIALAGVIILVVGAAYGFTAANAASNGGSGYYKDVGLALGLSGLGITIEASALITYLGTRHL